MSRALKRVSIALKASGRVRYHTGSCKVWPDLYIFSYIFYRQLGVLSLKNTSTPFLAAFHPPDLIRNGGISFDFP